MLDVFQSLGLSLNEIRDILKVSDRGELPCEEVKQHLALKVEEINHQITALEILKTELQQLLNHWQDHPLSVQVNTKICPNIQGEPLKEIGKESDLSFPLLC